MSSTAGVYRSIDYVVIERHSHQFPARCFWCNRALTEPPMAAATPAANVPLPRLPVCKPCHTQRHRRPRFALAVGIAAWTAAALLFFWLDEITGSLGSLLPAILASMLVIIGLSAAVIAFELRVTATGYAPTHVDEQYVWVSGANRDFLGALPDWSGMTLNEVRRAHR